MENTMLDKWAPLLNESIGSTGAVATQKQAAAAVMLENQANYILAEAENVTGGIAKWDPILIGMVRRAIPKMIAFDIAGVQPMTGPSGLIFTMRSRYNTQAGAEAIRETIGSSGTGTNSVDIFSGDFGGTTNADHAKAYLTAIGETLGTGGTNPDFKEMAFSIEKHSVIAGTRALKASWSTELEQDLRAIHGMSAEAELVAMLENEISQDLNRELLRKMYFVAKLGAAGATVAGKFDLNADANGRWSVEKYKGLLMQIEIEANAIATDSLRGKGNFVVTTTNVASALAMTGLLDGVPNSPLNNGLVVDTTSATLVGTIMNRVAVYVDPWGYDISGGKDFVLVGYKGASATDSAIIYAPYTPVEMMKVVNPTSFQPSIGMKTRYAMSNAPLETGSTAFDVPAYRSNPMLRIFQVENLF